MVQYNIYLFRHGESFYNKRHVFTGWKNPRLTPLGVEQAKIVAKMLKDKEIDVAFYNTLTRTKMTLNEVLRYHPECKKIIADKRMIERSYGDLAGLKHESIIKKYGEAQFEKWHRGYNTPPPNGESFADVEIRVKDFIRYLKKFIKKEKVNVAISASGNSIRLFRKIWENKPKSEVVKWKIPWDNYYNYTIEV